LTSGIKFRRFSAETVFNILFKYIVAQLSRYFKSKAKKDEKSFYPKKQSRLPIISEILFAKMRSRRESGVIFAI